MTPGPAHSRNLARAAPFIQQLTFVGAQTLDVSLHGLKLAQSLPNLSTIRVIEGEHLQAVFGPSDTLNDQQRSFYSAWCEVAAQVNSLRIDSSGYGSDEPNLGSAARMISTFSSLKRLSIKFKNGWKPSNPASEASHVELADAIAHCTSLESLEMRHDQSMFNYRDFQTGLLAETWAQQPRAWPASLRSFRLQTQCTLGPTDLAFVSLLAPQLERLELHHSNMVDGAPTSLPPVAFPHLRHLDLTCLATDAFTLLPRFITPTVTSLHIECHTLLASYLTSSHPFFAHLRTSFPSLQLLHLADTERPLSGHLLELLESLTTDMGVVLSGEERSRLFVDPLRNRGEMYIESPVREVRSLVTWGEERRESEVRVLGRALDGVLGWLGGEVDRVKGDGDVEKACELLELLKDVREERAQRVVD